MTVAPLLGADAVASPTDAAPAAPTAAMRREATAGPGPGSGPGPGPGPEVACTIGGVIANNSSGMAAGLHGDTAARQHGVTTAAIRRSTRRDSTGLACHDPPVVFPAALLPPVTTCVPPAASSAFFPW